MTSTKLDNTFKPESITFITTLSACINTVYFISALGMGIFSASAVGITCLVLLGILIISIAFIVSWIDKKNYQNQRAQFKLLDSINLDKLKNIRFPTKILSQLKDIPSSYSWRLKLLLFMSIIADILVFINLLTTLSFFIFGPALLQDFSYQLFLLCFSSITALILCCFRSYNYDVLISNRNKIRDKAISIINLKTTNDSQLMEKTLTHSQLIIGIVIGLVVTCGLFFLINHLLLITQIHFFSHKLISLITMIESYIHGYSFLASCVVGYIVFRIYRSIILENPDWQMINSFINVISTYLVVIIFTQRFIVIFVTLFSIPISAPQIALINFLIPVIASVLSIFHAYSFFTFYSADRELNVNIESIDECIKSHSISQSSNFKSDNTINSNSNEDKLPNIGPKQ